MIVVFFVPQLFFGLDDSYLYASINDGGGTGDPLASAQNK